MELWIDINTPTMTHHHVNWPERVPYPSVGDTVQWLQGLISWTFVVQRRHIGIGTAATGQPAAQIVLTVDSEVPPGFAL